MKKYNIIKDFLLLFIFLSFNAYKSIGQEFSFKIGGLERNYLVRLPQNYELENQFSLLMFFHGYGLTKEHADECYGFTQHADTTGYIVVYPQGVNKAWYIQNDIGFLSALIDTICKNYKVNRNRIYVAGHSQGAALVNNLVYYLHNEIAAFADISGSYNSAHNYISRPVPFLKIHGTNDSIVPYELAIDYQLPFWQENNKALILKDSVVLPNIVLTDSSFVIRYTYGEDNSEIIFYKIINGGHDIPGWCIENASGFTNRDINTPQVLWDFFNRHELERTDNSLSLNLVSSDKLWSTLKQCGYHCNSTEFNRFSGDTIINSKLYTKVFQSKDSLMSNWKVIGYVRQESSKEFYFMKIDGFEGLLYKYDLKINDIFTIRNRYYDTSGPISLVVASIDSIIINGTYRKQFTLNYAGEIERHADTWIEGIGSITGILSVGTPEISTELLCFYEYDSLIYKNPYLSECYYGTSSLSSINENYFDNKWIHIFPNPAKDYIYLNGTFENQENINISLYSYEGKKVYNKILYGVAYIDHSIDIQNLKSGIYFLKINSSEVSSYEKIIIQ